MRGDIFDESHRSCARSCLRSVLVLMALRKDRLPCLLNLQLLPLRARVAEKVSV